MSTAVAIHWNASSLHYVVAKNGRVETYSSLELAEGAGPAAISKQLADALAQQISGRATTIVGPARSSLEWQHLSLPPCPAEELPDLVRMQSDREPSTNGDEDLGFDYLPLAGDAETPYQVLTVAMPQSKLNQIRQICREAELTLDRLVPLAAGWPSLTAQAGLTGGSKSQVFVTPLDNEATVWATQGGSVLLFRQFQYASNDDVESKARAIGSEIRRTLLSLSQYSNFTKPRVTLLASNKQSLAELTEVLDAQLDVPVQATGISEKHLGLAGLDNATPQLLALAGLALEESAGKPPLVDLLNPRRRPQAEVNYRTFALAGIAAALLLVALGWGGYRNLKAPLEKAAEDRAAIALLEESSEQLAEYEQDAAAVRTWLAESPNLLVHLQQLSQTIRPKALDAEDYPVERDFVVEKLNLDKRQLVLDALAHSSQAVQPLEMRLREASYSPERGKSGPSEKQDYPWKFQSIITLDAASDAAANKVAATEATENDTEQDAPSKQSPATEEATS